MKKQKHKNKLTIIISFFINLFFLASPSIGGLPNTINSKIIKEYTLNEKIRVEFENFVNNIDMDPYQNYGKYYQIAGKELDKLLPNEIKSQIRSMDQRGPDLIIIHNFPVDSFIPETPRDSRKPPSKSSDQENAKGFVSEAAILGLGYTLNAEPFYKKEEKDGTIINQIIPVDNKKHKIQRSSYGSTLELLPHTENVYQIPPLKYFALLCLRGDPKVATSIIFLDDIISYIEKKYPEKIESILNLMKKPLFKMSAGPSHGKIKSQSILPIIEMRKEGEAIFRLNLNPDRTVGITPEAEEVVTLLRQIITSQDFKEKSYKRIYLSSGDLILFKNWRVMHSRDAFEIDQKHWRWLQRCYFK